MKSIQHVRLPLFVLLLLTVQASTAVPPERDIVAVESALPLSDTQSVPGLLTGQRILDGLRGALDLVRGGVPDAARPGLDELSRELRRLRIGDAPVSPLPASYWRYGQLWLPVSAEQLRVRLNAPGPHPWRRPGRTDGQPGNLPARARRTKWLPVELTAQRVDRVLPLLSAGEPGRVRAQRLLEATLRGPSASVVLEDRPLILAYYAVEDALGAARHWDRTVRGRLRHAADALGSGTATADLAARLQVQAQRLTPDARGLEDLAGALRKRIELAGGARPAGGRQ
jgi:hypothetical protein